MEHPIATAIEVSVKPRYIVAQSRPAQQRYVYAYTVTIANNGDVTAQLMGRHWVIRDERNKRQEVKGVGVVGEQPRLAPGKSYTYTSGVVLEAETGLMEGSYDMRTDDGEVFQVPIPAFALVPPHALH